MIAKMCHTTKRLTFLILLILIPAIASAADVEIHHFDVGNGDCALVLGTNGRGLIIDCGTVWWCKTGDPDRIINRMEILLDGNDFYMLASHYHSDHVGYFDEIIGRIGQPLIAFDRAGSYDSGAFDNYLAAVTSPANVRQTIQLGDLGAQGLNLGEGVSVACLLVEGNLIDGGTVSVSDENSRSISTLITVNAFDYLTAGDSHDYIEAELGSAVTSFTNNGIDVVKVNHHGSRYSSDAGFLAEVSPEVAVCSVGYYSSFGHPTQDAYGRLNDAGAYIYQTCPGAVGSGAYEAPPLGWGVLVDDDVVISTDGINYSVTNGVDFDWYVADDVISADGFESGDLTGW